MGLASVEDFGLRLVCGLHRADWSNLQMFDFAHLLQRLPFTLD